MGTRMIGEPVGHEAIRAMLRALAAQRAGGADAALQHAWLFSGPAGVGKFQVARWWAALLKCPSFGAGQAGSVAIGAGLAGSAEPGTCGADCESCRLVRGAVHPDVFETGPAPKEKNAVQSADVEIERKKTVGVDESRALLQRLAMRPLRPGPRVAIVREAGTMTAEAQNALLKMLEEPPGSAVIILVSDNVASMLPTIRSRCRHLAFGALSDHEVVQVLLRLGKEKADAEAAAACARGSVARALALDAEGLADREQTLLAFEAARADATAIEPLVQALAARKDEGYALIDLLEWQVAKIHAALGRAPKEPSSALATVLASCSEAQLHGFVEEGERVLRTIDAVARNANAKLVIRDLLLNVRA